MMTLRRPFHFTRLRNFLAVSILLSVFASLQAKAELKLCNSTSSRVGIAIGFKEPKEGWTSEGWWNVDSQSCSILITNKLSARFYYVHAIDYDKGGEWGGMINMCTAEGEFTIRGIDNCESRGYKKTGFFEVDTQELNEWTIKLTDQADPSAQSGGAPAASAPSPAPPAPSAARR